MKKVQASLDVLRQKVDDSVADALYLFKKQTLKLLHILYRGNLTQNIMTLVKNTPIIS